MSADTRGVAKLARCPHPCGGRNGECGREVRNSEQLGRAVTRGVSLVLAGDRLKAQDYLGFSCLLSLQMLCLQMDFAPHSLKLRHCIGAAPSALLFGSRDDRPSSPGNLLLVDPNLPHFMAGCSRAAQNPAGRWCPTQLGTCEELHRRPSLGKEPLETPLYPGQLVLPRFWLHQLLIPNCLQNQLLLGRL